MLYSMTFGAAFITMLTLGCQIANYAAILSCIHHAPELTQGLV